jgi:hypothetical protein
MVSPKLCPHMKVNSAQFLLMYNELLYISPYYLFEILRERPFYHIVVEIVNGHCCKIMSILGVCSYFQNSNYSSCSKVIPCSVPPGV